MTDRHLQRDEPAITIAEYDGVLASGGIADCFRHPVGHRGEIAADRQRSPKAGQFRHQHPERARQGWRDGVKTRPVRQQRVKQQQWRPVARLRRMAEKRYLGDNRHTDAWAALRAIFRLFDESGAGRPLGIEPLGGDLFDSGALGPLAESTLDNATLLACLRNLALFRNPDTGQLMRVNYAALNVEEFGSVYQGLLEFEPRVTAAHDRTTFTFAAGDERSHTGSHYTPEELGAATRAQLVRYQKAMAEAGIKAQ